MERGISPPAHISTGYIEVRMSTTRRLFLYLLALITLGVLAGGVGQLISLFLDLTIRTQTTQVGGREFSYQQLSLGMAMIVIGGPLWFFFWRSIQRRVIDNVAETGSILRKLYLNLILLETSFMAIIGATDSLRWLLEGANRENFNSGTIASFVVAGVIWFYHWHISETEGHPSSGARTLRRWYVYILSGFGLLWFTFALVEFVSASILSLPIWSGTIVSAGFWNSSTQGAVTRIIFGGVVWYFHWFRMAKGDIDSVLRQVYFYLLTVTGGAIAALVAVTVTLQRIITWALGGVTSSTSSYFQFIGWAIPTMIIATAVWGYHQRLVKEESAQLTERRQSSERVHLYLMSFIGLGTMAAGLILLFAPIFNLAIGITGKPIIIGTSWWQSQFGLCLAMLIVGIPLWLYYWGKVLKRTEGGGVEEWRASSRRLFLYAVVVISIGTLIADFVNIIYQILNGILQGQSTNILRESRWSIQTLLVAAPILWYHWRIVRADQKRGAEALAVRKIVTLLTSDRAKTMVSKIQEKLGYQVHVLYRVGAGAEVAITEEDLARIKLEIESSPAPKVMIIEIDGKLVTVPYQDK